MTSPEDKDRSADGVANGQNDLELSVRQPGDEGFEPPLTQGTHVYLRPVAPEDYAALRMADLSPQLGMRWRFRGTTPTFEEWVQRSQGTLAQFLVITSAKHQAIGIVVAYGHSFQDQHVYVAIASLQPAARSPLLMLGSAMFIQYVFRVWNFRKMYFELPAYNLSQFAYAERHLLVQEARLREHVYYDGKFWDKVILALYRTTWEGRAPRVLAAANAGSDKRGVLRRHDGQSR